jgi:hypothetical protein
MARALGNVRSYHFEGTETEDHGTGRVRGDVTATGSIRLRIDNHEQHGQIIVVGRRAFVTGNSYFWGQQGGPGSALTSRIAGHWVEVPSGAGSLTGITRFLPRSVAACAMRARESLTLAGRGVVDGRRVRVLSGRGERLFIAETGSPLLVRAVQSRARLCGIDENSSISMSDLHFSAYNVPVAITVPAGGLHPPSSG